MTFAIPSLSLVSKETLAMTIYEPDTLHIGTGLRGDIWNRISLKADSVIRRMQYARMKQAISALSDDQLATLGLTRADIPRHVHACVYDRHS